MASWMLGTVFISLLTVSLLGQDKESKIEDKQETAAIEKNGVVELGKKDSQEEIRRRWIKKTKPGAPKARKVTPGRKRNISSAGKVVELESQAGNVAELEGTCEDDYLPTDDRKSG